MRLRPLGRLAQALGSSFNAKVSHCRRDSFRSVRIRVRVLGKSAARRRFRQRLIEYRKGLCVCTDMRFLSVQGSWSELKSIFLDEAQLPNYSFKRTAAGWLQ